MDDVKLNDEPARLAALHRYDLLDALPEPTFDRIVALVRSVLGVPIAAVTLIDEHRQWFSARSGLEANETSRDASFCTHTIRARAPMLVDNARTDPRFSASPLVVGPPFIVSYAGVPLSTPDGYNVGALCAIDRVPREFTAAEVATLTGFAGIVMESFELRQIARRDHLTGFLTRRALIEAMARELAAQRRGGGGGAVIVFDIDRFKAINDRFGHAAGDRTLTAIAAACAQAAGDEGCLGRIGGEEFAWLLPGIDAAGAGRAAERLRVAIQAIPAAPGMPGVTASFGIASLCPEINSVEDWLTAADHALYCAKREGRNRVRLAARPAPGLPSA